MNVITSLKILAALACAGGIVWLFIKQTTAQLGMRILITVAIIVTSFACYGLVVSARCDMGNLPSAEC